MKVLGLPRLFPDEDILIEEDMRILFLWGCFNRDMELLLASFLVFPSQESVAFTMPREKPWPAPFRGLGARLTWLSNGLG